jgi:hypothetical protein
MNYKPRNKSKKTNGNIVESAKSSKHDNKPIIKNDKAQIISFDFSTSFIVFLIFIVVFILFIFFNNNNDQQNEFELEYVFANFENNLRHDLVSDRDFFSNYRINKEKLDNFADSVSSIDAFVVGNISGTHGIGLDDDAYDVCLYLIDNDNNLISMSLSGKVAIGWLDKTGISCNDTISASRNPCEDYSQAISFFKPVLFDEGDSTKNRIVQMDIVMCKK